ncbi:MAG: M48 family metalloprotease [Candidatus Rokubacteria bacterium]|nr:M48 family metalloprotease [Candidatus Rokubacteria bacterium]
MDRAARYHRIQLALGAVGLVIGVAYLAAAIAVDAGHALDAAARRLTEAWSVRVAFVAAVLGAGHRLLTFPLAWVRGWLLPRRFGLLHQPLGAWLVDRLKAAALGAILGLVVLEGVYALLRSTALWWLWATGFVLLLSLLATAIFPVLVVPLFYRMAPLADDALRRRLLALAERAGTPAVDVFVVDQSRKSRTANAGLTGFGRTRRIILFDTLVTEFTPDEIEAVLAHELGHHVHRDLWRGLALQTVISFVTFAAAHAILVALQPISGLTRLGDPAGLAWLAVVLGGLGLLAVPLGNTVSRALEYRADGFAVRTTANRAAFVAALERLGDLNLAERRPPRLEEVLLHSHPALDRRIAVLTRGASSRLQ